MLENNFQVSTNLGRNVQWNFGSKLVMQVAKDLEPEEKLILTKLRFKCDQRCFKVIVQAHGYPSALLREGYTSTNIGHGDESPKHTLISNSSETVQQGWISIYFHAEPPDPETLIDIDGPQELHSADSIWCEFAIENGVNLE